MPMEFIGMIATREASEVKPPTGPVVDVDFTGASARVHEHAGFDRVLIGYFSNAPDGFVIATDVLGHTERLGVLLAHRPGFVAPAVAARKLAAVDQFSDGRLAVHVISGGSDVDQRRRLPRPRRALPAHRRVPRDPAFSVDADAPIDHAGDFYRFEGAWSEVRCRQDPHIPIYFGGSSDVAVQVAARHADVYAMWGEPLESARRHIERVKAAQRRTGAHRESGSSVAVPVVGSQRLLDAAATREVHDARLFVGVRARASRSIC